MFMRRTATRNTATGESYFTYRLVGTERVGGKVRQITLLHLGRGFGQSPQDWPVLCLRIEQILSAQDTLLAAKCSARIEAAAQRYAGQLVGRAPSIEAA